MRRDDDGVWSYRVCIDRQNIAYVKADVRGVAKKQKDCGKEKIY